MRPKVSRNRIYPKISTMPRPQTEAAAVLDIYKLLVEKNRLQQELDNIERRRQQINERLLELEQQVAELEQATQSGTSMKAATPAVATTVTPNSSAASDPFNLLFLDY